MYINVSITIGCKHLFRWGGGDGNKLLYSEQNPATMEINKMIYATLTINSLCCY